MGFSFDECNDREFGILSPLLRHDENENDRECVLNIANKIVINNMIDINIVITIIMNGHDFLALLVRLAVEAIVNNNQR